MANIEEFRDTYLRLCKDHHIDTQDGVLNQLKCAMQTGSGRLGRILDLSTQSLNAKTCAVLGKVFATDRTFSELRFNDCMLPEEGVRALALGLAANMVVKKLEMKGNNIRGSATEGLGQMLKQNTTLLSLCLEWNSMGMLDSSFGIFCEGLSSNGHLQVLDLRNNQITHDGAAELGMALKRNLKLKAVDLRWNTIGLIGGRSMLAMLQHNRHVIKLQLAGNNIPGDVMQAIETAVGHNMDRDKLDEEHSNRQRMLSSELRKVKKDKNVEVGDLLDRLDRQEKAIRNSTKSSQGRIQQLQEALEDRKSQFHDMASKLGLADSELALSETKIRELSGFLSSAKEEQAEMARHHSVELKRGREEKALMEARLNKEILEVQERCIQLENKLDEANHKINNQQENLFDMKEQLAHNQAELRLKTATFEEKIAGEKLRTKEAYRDADELKQKELSRLRQEADETEKMLKDRLGKLEAHRLEQEEEICRLKAAVVAEKLNGEESILLSKQRIKSEEEQRYHQLEEKLRLVQGARDELQSHSSQQATTICDLQTKNANSQLEVETLKHKIEDLQTHLAGKNNEIMQECNKVRLEMNQRIQKLENERMSHQDLYDKINSLEKQHAELETKHKTMCSEKDIELAKLSERLKSREAEIAHMRQDDAQRSSMLQTAIQSYVSRSPFTASTTT